MSGCVVRATSTVCWPQRGRHLTLSAPRIAPAQATHLAGTGCPLYTCLPRTRLSRCRWCLLRSGLRMRRHQARHPRGSPMQTRRASRAAVRCMQHQLATPNQVPLLLLDVVFARAVQGRPQPNKALAPSGDGPVCHACCRVIDPSELHKWQQKSVGLRLGV
jgi:hypothetical protein